MTKPGNVEFDEIWLIDFEFSQPTGERPCPVCMVALELISGRAIRLFERELWDRRSSPPFSVSRKSLFVAYYAIAEMACFLVLGWQLPECVLDLYTEFRCLTNGRETPAGNSLLGALVCFGLDAMNAVEKDTMRQLAMRGGPWTEEEKAALLEYCESDVVALRKLLERMLPKIDLAHALLRGRYMKAAARIEHVGVPIDTDAFIRLRENWEDTKDELIRLVDGNYHVYDRQTFKEYRFKYYLSQHNIPWPQLESGSLQLDDETFRLMAELHPRIEPLRQLRTTLSEMRLSELSVGSDGRNRCGLSAFRSRTGRNQPSNAKFIFGPSAWIRGLIKPAPGYGIAYIDWEQQEFGIAAALSRDAAMLNAYESGDPYLAFAKQARAVPEDATKATHERVREQFKQCALGVLYGMGAESLAQRIGQSGSHARELLHLHCQTYATFWRWSDAAVDYAMLKLYLQTAFGWPIHVGPQVNPRCLRNFPMQANGAEMLRLAACFATENGIEVCALVHDAILIQAPLDSLEEAVRTTQQAMARASKLVLGGFELRSEVKLVRHPERYENPRGTQMWNLVWNLIEKLEAEKELLHQ